MRTWIAFTVLCVSLTVHLTDGASARQSPIDLFGYSTASFSPFVFGNFSTAARSVELLNNGHTVRVNLPAMYEVSGGGLPEAYIPLQFHLHWDQIGSGSEHSMFGEKYPAELHVVMRRKSLSLNDAVSGGQKDGLAVLGFFIQEAAQENTMWKELIAAAMSVQNADVLNETTIGGDFILADVLSNGEMRYGDFFRYSGSLTTPTYNEVVEWTVFSKPIGISRTQLDVIRGFSSKGYQIESNYRELQSRDGRAIQVQGQGLLEEQSKMLASPETTNTDSDAKKSSETMVPGSTVTAVFVILGIIVIGSVLATAYLAYSVRSSSK